MDYDAWICSEPEPSEEPDESVTERIARERAEYEEHCERVFDERRDDELIEQLSGLIEQSLRNDVRQPWSLAAKGSL